MVTVTYNDPRHITILRRIHTTNLGYLTQLMSLSDDTQADVIDAFNTTSDIWTIC